MPRETRTKAGAGTTRASKKPGPGGASVAEAEASAAEIIEAAKRSAREIRREAEADLRRHADGRRSGDERRLQDWERRLEAREQELERIAIFLRERVSEVSARAQDMARAVDKALVGVQSRDPAADSGPPPLSGAPGLRVVDTDESPERQPAAPAQDLDPESALLRAAQMAIAGRDEREIRAAMREQLGVSDVDRAFERILGDDDDSR